MEYQTKTVWLQHIPTQLRKRHTHRDRERERDRERTDVQMVQFANMWSNKQTDKNSNFLTSLHTDKMDVYLLRTWPLATKDTEMKKSDRHNRGTYIRIANPHLDKPNQTGRRLNQKYDKRLQMIKKEHTGRKLEVLRIITSLSSAIFFSATSPHCSGWNLINSHNCGPFSINHTTLGFQGSAAVVSHNTNLEINLELPK